MIRLNRSIAAKLEQVHAVFNNNITN